ncbi:MAG: hypothetical protein MUC88_04640, partial [Planctomycetes bacterium]|nr:hypothetical protein [Planctomycetota bacterium]
MTARRRANVILMGLMAAGLASCAANDTTVTSAAFVPSVPPLLQTLGDRSEETILAATADNWPQLYACVKDVCDAWQEFKYPSVVSVSYRRPPASVLQGPLDASVARLRAAAGKG